MAFPPRIGKAKKLYKRIPYNGILLSREQFEETSPIGSRMKSKSKFNKTPILMARNDNETVQILNVLEKLQTRMDESDKRIEAMDATLQTITKDLTTRTLMIRKKGNIRMKT